MSPELVTAVAGIMTTVTGSCLSWFLARRKYNSEVDNNLIENMQNSLDFYKKLSDDNKNRLEEVLKRNEALELEVNQLKQQVFNLMSSICLNLTCINRVHQTPVPPVHSISKTNK